MAQDSKAGELTHCPACKRSYQLEQRLRAVERERDALVQAATEVCDNADEMARNWERNLTGSWNALYGSCESMRSALRGESGGGE